MFIRKKLKSNRCFRIYSTPLSILLFISLAMFLVFCFENLGIARKENNIKSRIIESSPILKGKELIEKSIQQKADGPYANYSPFYNKFNFLELEYSNNIEKNTNTIKKRTTVKYTEEILINNKNINININIHNNNMTEIDAREESNNKIMNMLISSAVNESNTDNNNNNNENQYDDIFTHEFDECFYITNPNNINISHILKNYSNNRFDNTKEYLYNDDETEIFYS